MDLTTNYLGLELKNPIVPSASPLSGEISSIKAMEDAGASAIVLYSLFEEQILREDTALEHYLNYGGESFYEALSYFPTNLEYNHGPVEYLEHIRKAKNAVDIPIIASLNGFTTGGWLKYAKLIEEAGADALELNLYNLPNNINTTSLDIENEYIEIIKTISSNIKIPLAVKLSPFFTSLPNFAKRASDAGAKGLVLFNRFYQPDIDLENLEAIPNLVLSTNWEMRLPLRWIAILYGKINTSFAITSGIHSYEDVLKSMMAGANVAMLCSELLRNGIGRITEILKDIEKWMEEKEYESIKQMQGSMSQKSLKDPVAYNRANYMKVLYSYHLD